MWKPPINFLTLHYTYIITCSLLGFILIVGPGNVPAVDAFFFGASGSTESGLNTIDVKELRLYQQIVIYVIPVITNLAFINIIVVVVRLYWFEKHFKANPQLLPLRAYRGSSIAAQPDLEAEGDKPSPENDEDEEPTIQDLQSATTIRFEDEPSKATTDKHIMFLRRIFETEVIPLSRSIENRP